MKLNFPVNAPKVEKKGDRLYIRDVIRKKQLSLTPEEWVRQHLLLHMTENLGYPANLIGVEVALNYEQLKKRCDVLVWHRDGSPWLIAECKAPYVQINEKVTQQIAVYNNKLRVPHLVLSNGMTHYIFSLKAAGYREVQDWPEFES